MAFTFIKVPDDPNYLAPDSSEIRLLPTFDSGGLCHCTLPANSSSKPVKHKTVDEIWYCISGQGIIWQKNQSGEIEREFTEGDSFTIPVGNSFQFKNTGAEPLKIIISTMPKWTGSDEAIAVVGKWENESKSFKKTILKQFFDDVVYAGLQAGLVIVIIGIISLLLFMLPKNVAEYLFESNSTMILRIAWFVFVIPLMIGFVWLITSERAIKTGLIKANVPSYIMATFSLYTVAGVLFSTVVYLFAVNEWVSINSNDGKHTVTISSLLDLFLWQFLDAIPALHINDLLNFKKPFEFDGKVGAMVLLFQLSVIFPIINFHKKIKTFKKKNRDEAI